MGEGGRAGVNACLWSYAGLLVAAGKSQGMSYGALICLNGYPDFRIASHFVLCCWKHRQGANTSGNKGMFLGDISVFLPVHISTMHIYEI